MWIVSRMAQAMLTAFAMVTLVFLGLHMIGSPVDILVAEDATLAEKARIIKQFGLDKPIWEQFFYFLRGVAHGEFGISYVFNEPAFGMIVSRLPATIELAVSAVLLSLIIGLPLGLLAGAKPNNPLSGMIMSASILGFSLPTFWVGILFIMVFSVQLGWLPSFGRGETRELFGIQWSFLTVDGLKHLILPAFNLALTNIAMVLRLTEAGTREIMGRDFILFARAKGLSPSRIMWTHVMKNIMIPVVTVIGLDFGSLVAFSIVTESIFAWPGVGKIIIDSIAVLDRPVIVAYLFMVVILFVCINLIVDVVYHLLDPRIRVGGQK
ncbi:MAG: ABC transporter permease [Puniceicoccales bacterium]